MPSSRFYRFRQRQSAAAAPAAVQPAVQSFPAMPFAATVPGLVSDYLFEEQVDLPKLLSLFKQAFVPVEMLDESRLLLTTDYGGKMLARVDARARLIAFYASFSFRAGTSAEQALSFVNRANSQLGFARFSAPDAETLFIDHELPFTGGVASASVVGTLRRLARVAQQAFTQIDTDDVVA